MKVGIFFFLPSLGGGSTTFTAHLYKAIEAAGHEPTIYKVRRPDQHEDFLRPFAKYHDVWYRNVSPKHARWFVRNNPSVMSAPAHSRYLSEPDVIVRLLKRGMRNVIHDPNEFKIYDYLEKIKIHRPICIRPTMKRFYKNAVWIPHPYMRSMKNEDAILTKTKYHAISVARIAPVKRPQIILEANRLLNKSLRIQLLGAEFRLYTRSLAEKYSDVFKQSGKTFQFPMTFEAPVELCSQAVFNVDMTYFPDDGGGTQYAQLEAMDAACVNIMHEDWFRYKGEVIPAKHVLTVNGPEQLARMLDEFYRYGLSSTIKVREAGFKLLKNHAPKVVGELYMEELLRV